jgi:hypothetical protein
VFTVGNWYVSNKKLLLAWEDGKQEFWERKTPFLIVSLAVSPINTMWFTIGYDGGNSRRVSLHELREKNAREFVTEGASCGSLR